MTQPRAKEISAYRDGISYPVRQKDFWNALARCAKACGEFNNLPNDATPEEKSAAWRKIVAPTSSAGTPVSSANDFPTPSVKGPIRIDYGLRVHIAADTFINHNCTILDTPVADVRIGKHCSLGPHVSIYSVGHNLNSDTHPRVSFGKPVTIEDGCWIGGNVTILGGVRIGAGSTIAAGSVVRSDIPPRSVAAGVPARVIRQIRPGEEHDAFPVASLHVALQIPSNHGGVEHMNEATRVRLDEFLGEKN